MPARNIVIISAVWQESKPPCKSSLRSAATSVTENLSPMGHLRPVRLSLALDTVSTHLVVQICLLSAHIGNRTKVIYAHLTTLLKKRQTEGSAFIQLITPPTTLHSATSPNCTFN